MAALEGSIAELNGIHRVNPGTLAVLQRYLGRGIPYKGSRSAIGYLVQSLSHK